MVDTDLRCLTVDELKARGWTQKQFARVLGRPMKVVSEIINGRTSITPPTAMELSAAFGTSASVWLNRSIAEYRQADPDRA